MMSKRTWPIVEFLTARLDEDEAVALKCEGPKWTAIEEKADLRFDHIVGGPSVEHVTTYAAPRESAHIVRHDPARVLADVAAKRRIIDQYVTASKGHGGDDPLEFFFSDTLLLLAHPYASHPDFDPAWAIGGVQDHVTGV